MLFSMLIAPLLAALPAHDVMRMDIAGVKLGMPLAEAKAEVERRGYQCKIGTGSIFTFEQRVQAEIARRKSVVYRPRYDEMAPASTECEGTKGEQLELFTRATRQGYFIKDIKMVIPRDKFNFDEVIAQIGTKFGKPTFGTVSTGTWCPNPTGCDGLGEPQFRTTLYSTLNIMGFSGSRVTDADETDVIAEADRRAPKAGAAAL